MAIVCFAPGLRMLSLGDGRSVCSESHDLLLHASAPVRLFLIPSQSQSNVPSFRYPRLSFVRFLLANKESIPSALNSEPLSNSGSRSFCSVVPSLLLQYLPACLRAPNPSSVPSHDRNPLHPHMTSTQKVLVASSSSLPSRPADRSKCCQNEMCQYIPPEPPHVP